MNVLRPTLALVLAVLAVAGCRGETTLEAPIVPLRNMFDQDRYDTQQESKFFPDGRTMRMPVANTVAREAVIHPVLGKGRLPDDTGYALEIPGPIVQQVGGMPALVARGRERYDIYCTPCHDGAGTGNGRVVERGKLNPPPPSLHDARVRQMPDGQLFATITNGVRNMPPYGPQMTVEDRWAVVGYVRALQVSQGGQ